MDNNQLIKQKQERFKALGIPMPIEKPAFDQPVMNVKDPNMLKRIQEIKNGAKKNEFNEILSVGDKKGFKPLPEPKKKNNQIISSGTKSQNENSIGITTPALESFSPVSPSSGGDLSFYDKLFSGEAVSTSNKSNMVGTGARIQEEVNYDTNGSDFLNNFRQKLQAKAASAGVTTKNSGFGVKTTYEQPVVNLNEIENKIYEISSEVSKKIAQETIKQVLDQYLSKKTNLQENTYQRIKDDIIKIEGKYYKLTPVKIKSSK